MREELVERMLAEELGCFHIATFLAEVCLDFIRVAVQFGGVLEFEFFKLLYPKFINI